MVVAGQLAEMAERVLDSTVPIGIWAWDGSVAGPQDGTVLVIRSRDALRRLVWSPNELGLARAYVSGELGVEGDLAAGLSQIWGLVRRGVTRRPRLVEVAKLALQLKVLGPNPSAPLQEARLRGTRHTKARDRDAISHHYDLSNDFYQLVLDPSMAYSCAYFTSSSDSLAQAQHNKLDRPVSATTGFLESAGFEIRDVHALREHYVRTVRAWTQTLEDRWSEVVALVGEGQARVWRLYLAGGALTFEEGRMGVDQILAVRRSPADRSGMRCGELVAR